MTGLSADCYPNELLLCVELPNEGPLVLLTTMSGGPDKTD